MDTAQEDMAERVHTGIERTDGTSNPSANIHPSDTAERHRNSEEARDSQSATESDCSNKILTMDTEQMVIMSE